MGRRALAWLTNERGCHICTSHRARSDGYPALWKDGRDQHMHRVLWEEKHGALGELVLRHTCDDRLCINELHHVPGTRKDNSRDMVERGRCNTRRGESRSDAKLTSAQVEEIRQSGLSQYKLAANFGVNQSTISRIQARKRRRFE